MEEGREGGEERRAVEGGVDGGRKGEVEEGGNGRREERGGEGTKRGQD